VQLVSHAAGVYCSVNWLQRVQHIHQCDLSIDSPSNRHILGGFNLYSSATYCLENTVQYRPKT